MPFTPSHVAAILPFVRTPLAPAALSLGAMAPDIPYFLPIGVPRALSHSLLGVPTIDLLVGVVGFVLWVLVLRAPVLDYGPGWLRERMSPAPRWRVSNAVVSALLVVAALELGTLTHLLLDAFTHEGGWLDTVAPWAGQQLGTFSVANVIHLAVSVVTGVIVGLWVRRWVARTPRSSHPTKLRGRERPATWIGLLLLLGVVGAIRWLVYIAGGKNPLDPDILGHSFFVAVSVSGGVALLLAIVWRLRRVA